MPGSSPSSTNGGKQRPGCQKLSARPVREWERRSWHRSRGVPTISSSGALKRPIIRSSSPSSAIRPIVSAAGSMRDTGSSWRGRRASTVPAGRRVLAEGDFSIDHRGRSARRSRAQPGRRRRRDHGHSILPHPGCGRFGAARRRNYWEDIAGKAGRIDDLREYTTVTKRLRRVGCFDPVLVKRALAANRPTRLVLNHLDYLGTQEDLEDPRSNVRSFVHRAENDIDREVDWLGFSAWASSKGRCGRHDGNGTRDQTGKGNSEPGRRPESGRRTQKFRTA